MFGNNIIHLSEVDSTNNFIAKLISEGKAPIGTVILADIQTAGKGQRGNNWTNNGVKQFAASYFVDTAFLSVDAFVYFNFAVALAVKFTIQSLIEEKVWIKWPNDIFVGSKKIAGILIETNLKNHQINSAVVGIGVNLNPIDGIVHATSLKEYDSSVQDGKSLLLRMNASLNHYFDLLKRGEVNKLKDEYETHLWLKNQLIPIVVRDTGETFHGIIRAVNEIGNIVIECNGELREFRNQELSFEMNYASS